MLPAIRWLL